MIQDKVTKQISEPQTNFSSNQRKN